MQKGGSVMAVLCSKFGEKMNATIMEFVLDTEDEIQYLPTTEKQGTGEFEQFNHVAPIGSIAVVGNDGGDLLIYELFSFGWKKLS